MDFLKHLNDMLAYIESNLCDDLDPDKLAQIACMPKDGFPRVFRYMTGMTLTEYMRCRRLTLAAYELRSSDIRVIDVAVKYGWSSADAFTKAFVRQHGITPTQARDPYVALQVYPPASFCILVKGARKMNLRIIELEQTVIYGVSQQFDGMNYSSKEELRNIMWSEDCDFVPRRICDGYDGIWYGIWQNGKYMIARKKDDVKTDDLETALLPSGTYAAFRTERGGLAWEELPKLWDLIFDSWLPNSNYRKKDGPIVEVLHLWTDRAMRRKNRYYEIWVPIENK